jgi:hypothetical protein
MRRRRRRRWRRRRRRRRSRKTRGRRRGGVRNERLDGRTYSVYSTSASVVDGSGITHPPFAVAFHVTCDVMPCT